MTARPIVLSMGDPSGIGPEIAMRAMRERPTWREKVILLGDTGSLRRAAALGQTDVASALAALPLAELGDFDQWREKPRGAVGVLQLGDPLPVLTWGRVDPRAGAAAARAVRAGANAVLQGVARALVTAPLHKEALHAAGEPFPGHTELLQAMAAHHLGRPVDEVPVRMMLSAPDLATVLVSIHVSLRAAIDAVTRQSVLETIRITHAHLRRTGIAQPRIAVAGLNPHAGEGGLFGVEEIEHIAPAVQDAQSEGLTVSGPFPPDTVFMRTRQGAFDVVIAMYHDQGLIPVKLLGVEHGVNTTLGLPLIRTSPDHGTAFDIAGRGVASAASLIAALEAADAASALSA
ncbi:MAG: 4-hydroxythreonine-4-phosphate dehydrogenase PdxA [Hydrogenophaga sp.]|uniref:4-hydroxythreonine-4-phosphate dehydrogenase PdxA n=1 Tax=Hydrogenophaga sp. TaxID=1904254 RepID=UPI001D4E41BB|nr:4-hydroxythreonine-4-phosphate dehydrogenase PdxA [Hydrogenophaga sp.]MBX3611727.1 4-hydroxythreonine-4-phosphate dehydrogenase PdxA [Hydrogenophaga sp.]